MSAQKYTLILLAILAVATTEAMALDYTSYFFTTDNVTFFAYEDDTSVALTDSTGNPVIVDPCVLNKGGHVFVNTSLGVYKASANKKFAVLTGDADTNGISGYYAMRNKREE